MSTNAKLCDICGMGVNQEKCIICGRVFSRNMAYLCNFCASSPQGGQVHKVRPAVRPQAGDALHGLRHQVPKQMRQVRTALLSQGLVISG